MEFSRPEYWILDTLFLLQGIFPTQGSNLRTQVSRIAGWFFTSWGTREACNYFMKSNLYKEKWEKGFVLENSLQAEDKSLLS